MNVQKFSTLRVKHVDDWELETDFSPTIEEKIIIEAISQLFISEGFFQFDWETVAPHYLPFSGPEEEGPLLTSGC